MSGEYVIPPGDYARSERLAGRVVLVTGALTALGRAAALACARAAADVILMDGNARQLEKLYDELTEAGGREPVLVEDDPATLDAGRVDLLAAQVDGAFGRLDALLHLTAEANMLSPLANWPPDRFATVIHRDLVAPWLLVRGLLPLLKAAPRGRVVCLCDRSGREPSAYQGPIAIAAAGIDAQIRLWQEENAANTGLRFVALDPGPVFTPSRARMYPGERPTDVPQPADIAGVFVHLANDGARLGTRLSVVEGALEVIAG